MSLENIKSSIKKMKNASLENCLRQMLDKMETQEKINMFPPQDSLL